MSLMRLYHLQSVVLDWSLLFSAVHVKPLTICMPGNVGDQVLNVVTMYDNWQGEKKTCLSVAHVFCCVS